MVKPKYTYDCIYVYEENSVTDRMSELDSDGWEIIGVTYEKGDGNSDSFNVIYVKKEIEYPL